MFQEGIRDIISHVNRQKPALDLFIVTGVCLNEEDARFILDNCRATHHILLNFEFPRTFQHDIKLSSSGFGCIHSHWLTIDNLISLDCALIQLYGSEFTQQDLNQFVKHWIAGANPRLEALLIYRNLPENVLLNDLDIVDGVQFVQMDSTVRRPYLVKENMMPPCRVICCDGFDIERNDGAKATIYLVAEMFLFLVGPLPTSQWLEIDHHA
ncbi:unnamed protein product [Caenorhabditis sp. 36 PRJEB53466]|nr:unnamed protein product [Caenorhabditis sp. 36 PRJEB53466]